MLCMLTLNASYKISKAFNAMYVDAVDAKDIDSKHITRPITFLIFNLFSIRKKFWKAKTKCFSTIPLIAMDVESVNASCKISQKFNGIDVDTVNTN